MTVSAFATGTQTATIGTEHFLSNVNVAGKFCGVLDVSVMQANDVLELRAYQMVLTSGTSRVVDFMMLSGAQPSDQAIVEWGKDLVNELTDTNSLRYSIKQTFGTGRAYPWKVVNEQLFPSNFNLLSVDANGRIDIIKIAGTTQTARDIGTSVLLAADQAVNATKWAGGTIPAPNVTGVPIIDLKYILGTVLTETAGQIAAAFKKFFDKATPTGTINSIPDAVAGASSGLAIVGSVMGKSPATLAAADVSGNITADLQTIKTRAITDPGSTVAIPTSIASPTNITAGTITTVTNLTNAPTSGDFNSTMKTSLNAATPAVTVSDKTGFSLSSAGIQAIWDALTSLLTTASSIGKLLVDNINATISSRSTYAGGDTSGTTTLLSRLTSGRATNLDNIDVATSTRSSHTAADVWTAVTRTLTSISDSSGVTTLLSRLTSGRATLLDNLDATISGIATAVWGNTTRTISAFGFSVTIGTNNDKSGYSLSTPPLDASGTRTALGLSSANLDSQLSAISGYIDSEITSLLSLVTTIKTKTDNLPSDTAANVTSILAYVDELESRLTAIRAGYLDNLASLATPPTVAAIRAEMDSNSTRLADIQERTDLIPDQPATLGQQSTIIADLLALNDISAADVWAHGTRTLTSFGTLVSSIWANVTRTLTSGGGGGGGSSASEIWQYPQRTLTQTASQIEASQHGRDLILYNKATASFTLSGLRDFTNYEKIWFTVKDNPKFGDSKSVIQIFVSQPVDVNDGLQYINKAIITDPIMHDDGTITVIDTTTITIVLSSAAMQKLTAGVYSYDIKAKLTDDTVILSSAEGKVKILDSVTSSIE